MSVDFIEYKKQRSCKVIYKEKKKYNEMIKSLHLR